jgi:hypothetical protein
MTKLRVQTPYGSASCGAGAMSPSVVVTIAPVIAWRTGKMSRVLNEGRLFGLGPVDWSVLLGSFALCELSSGIWPVFRNGDLFFA